MEKSLFQIAEQINQLHKKAYDIYLRLVDNVCRREVSVEEYHICLIICWTLPVMKTYWAYIKKVCRMYLYTYPSCVKSYIDVWWEMWEDEKDYLVVFS